MWRGRNRGLWQGCAWRGEGVTCEARMGLVKRNVFIIWDGEDTLYIRLGGLCGLGVCWRSLMNRILPSQLPVGSKWQQQSILLISNYL